MLAPSGLILRVLSPWATGFQQPPDWLTIQDSAGVSLIMGLVVKEIPFLVLMLLGALAQVPAERLMLTSRGLGYGRFKSWLVCVAPLLQRQIRWPIAAVLVYGMTNVEMAIPLGPQTPPPLSIMLWQWFTASRLELQDAAYAGAVLLFGATVLGLLILAAIGHLAGVAHRYAVTSGRRLRSDWPLRAGLLSLPVTVLLLGVATAVALSLRAASRMWRFPHLIDAVVDWSAPLDAAPAVEGSLATTLGIAAIVAVVAVGLTLVLAELLAASPRRRQVVGVCLFVPLVLPQLTLLFGLTWLTTRLRLEGTATAIVWSHLLFALPYAWGILAPARSTLDPRMQLTARTLGLGPLGAWWRVTVPLLLRSVLLAASIGFAVSAAVYLPTLFVGAGRIVTIATEAASAAASGSLRIAAIYGALQAALPLLTLGIASVGAHFVYRRFGGVPR